MTDVHAHRGFAGQYPENTLAALRSAAADGADAVEIDVAPSADGDPVVFHDARLDAEGESRGVTDGMGYVWETPTDDLRSRSVLDTDEGIPTLSEACRGVPADVALTVELKHCGGERRTDEHVTGDALDARREDWRPFVDRVAGVLDGFDHDILLSSFADGALAAARAVVPEHPRAVLYAGSTAEAVGRARTLDADAIHPPVSAVAGTRYFEPDEHGDVDVVDRATDEGWDVNVWTVRTWHEADRLAAAGVDGLIADYPGLLDREQ